MNPMWLENRQIQTRMKNTMLDQRCSLGTQPCGLLALSVLILSLLISVSLQASEQVTVVVGSYASEKTATARRDQLAARMDQAFEISPVDLDTGRFYRIHTAAVTLGDASRQLLAKLKAEGLVDGWLLPVAAAERVEIVGETHLPVEESVQNLSSDSDLMQVKVEEPEALALEISQDMGDDPNPVAESRPDANPVQNRRYDEALLPAAVQVDFYTHEPVAGNWNSFPPNRKYSGSPLVDATGSITPYRLWVDEPWLAASRPHPGKLDNFHWPQEVATQTWFNTRASTMKISGFQPGQPLLLQILLRHTREFNSFTDIEVNGDRHFNVHPHANIKGYLEAWTLQADGHGEVSILFVPGSLGGQTVQVSALSFQSPE